MLRAFRYISFAVFASLSSALPLHGDVIVGVADNTVVAPSSGAATVNLDVFLDLTGADLSQEIADFTIFIDNVSNPVGLSLTTGFADSIFNNVPGSGSLDLDTAFYFDNLAAGSLSPGAGPTTLIRVEVEVDSTVAPGDYDFAIGLNTLIGDGAGSPIGIDSTVAGTLTVVPEPGTLILAGLGFVVMTTRRRAATS